MTSSPDRLYLGIEIGGTKLQVAVGTREGRLIESSRAAVPEGATGPTIQEIILGLSRNLIRANPVDGVGVGFGGPVNVTTGTIIRSHHVDGWEGFSIRDWLAGALDLPVTVENDANTAALAEARLGAGKGMNPVFYITLGSGVGGGLVVDETIYHGRVPGEAEIGHLRLSPGGPILESVCSGWALDQKLVREARAHPEGVLAGLLTQMASGQAAALPQAIAADDAGARRALHETAETLAFGLSHVVHLMHPEIVVIGGGLSHLGDLLLDPVREQLELNIMDALRPPPFIRTAALGENVVPIGAILLAADRSRSSARTP